LTVHHVAISFVCHCEEMRRNFVATSSLVHLADALRVDGKTLVGIDDDAEETRIRVDHHGVVSLSQIVQHTRVIQEGEVGHILSLLELRWVHLLRVVLLQRYLSLGSDDGKNISLRRLDLSRNKSLFSICDPHILLRVELLRLSSQCLLLTLSQKLPSLILFHHLLILSTLVVLHRPDESAIRLLSFSSRDRGERNRTENE
ncbi:hypothetical protein PMAYCL1PPCAC_28876, partial [Pristionchus mayeri]